MSLYLVMSSQLGTNPVAKLKEICRDPADLPFPGPFLTAEDVGDENFANSLRQAFYPAPEDHHTS